MYLYTKRGNLKIGKAKIVGVVANVESWRLRVELIEIQIPGARINHLLLTDVDKRLHRNKTIGQLDLGTNLEVHADNLMLVSCVDLLEKGIMLYSR